MSIFANEDCRFTVPPYCVMSLSPMYALSFAAVVNVPPTILIVRIVFTELGVNPVEPAFQLQVPPCMTSVSPVVTVHSLTLTVPPETVMVESVPMFSPRFKVPDKMSTVELVTYAIFAAIEASTVPVAVSITKSLISAGSDAEFPRYITPENVGSTIKRFKSPER